VAYAETEDLLTGNIPTPGYLDPAKFVDDAADEIDSVIGFVYETPIDVSDASPVVRPARLLIKRINVFLATGRLLMAAASASEDSNLHAYALKMVNDGLGALEAIRSGEIFLEGATLLNPPTEGQARGPKWFNPDSESAVDAFYETLQPKTRTGSRVNGALWGTEWPRRSGDEYPVR
jgi:hypothetical protein